MTHIAPGVRLRHDPPHPVRPDGPFTADQCRRCWEDAGGVDRPGDPFYKGKRHRGQSPRPGMVRRKFGPQPCRFRGSQTGHVVSCATCTGAKEVPVLACSVHGRCTLSVLAVPDQAGQIKCCAICEDRQAATFDRVVVINLDRRPDRLATWTARVAACPQLVGWVRMRAVDGQDSPPPESWRGGAGAWGCRQSHLRVLEEAMQDGIDRLAVFEDDALFVGDFAERLNAFLAAVPSDWTGLMLGGQDQHRPELVAPGVGRTLNAQRTHAYVVRGAASMADLYQVFAASKTHIDRSFHHWQSRGRVYQPVPWLCGQGASLSDITGIQEPDRSWESQG